MASGSAERHPRTRPASSDRTILVVSSDTAWSDALRRRLAAWSDTADVAILSTTDSGRAAVYFDRMQPAVVVLDTVALDIAAVDLLTCRTAAHATVLLAGPTRPVSTPPASDECPSGRRIARAARAAAAAVQHAVEERLN